MACVDMVLVVGEAVWIGAAVDLGVWILAGKLAI